MTATTGALCESCRRVPSTVLRVVAGEAFSVCVDCAADPDQEDQPMTTDDPKPLGGEDCFCRARGSATGCGLCVLVRSMPAVERAREARS